MHLLRLRSGHWTMYPWGTTTNWTSCITPWQKDIAESKSERCRQDIFYGLFPMSKAILYPEETMGVISLTKPDVCSSGKVHRWCLHNPFINSEGKSNKKQWVDIDKDKYKVFKSIFGGPIILKLFTCCSQYGAPLGWHWMPGRLCASVHLPDYRGRPLSAAAGLRFGRRDGSHYADRCSLPPETWGGSQGNRFTMLKVITMNQLLKI